MIIVEIGKNENLERALKTLKSKVIKTKQQKILKCRVKQNSQKFCQTNIGI
jgi:ribosomal protein S21